MLKLSNGLIVNSIQIDIRNLDDTTYTRGYASTVVDAQDDDEWNDVLTKNARKIHADFEWEYQDIKFDSY